MNVRFRLIFLPVVWGLLFHCSAPGQTHGGNDTPKRILYGVASYYGKGFHGKKTASGEIFNQNKLTAACNVLPLGTWIRVTNLKNKRQVILKVNDRLHFRMRRIADLSHAAAEQLGYLRSGLTRVKIEVLSKKP